MTKTVIYQDINIEPFLRAIAQFHKYSQNLTDEQYQAGAIQAFECCYELSWKYIKKVLEKHDIKTESSRSTFREAARIGLISNPTQWFNFVELRNITVHTYNEATVEKIIAIFPEFKAALTELINNLQKETIA